MLIRGYAYSFRQYAAYPAEGTMFQTIGMARVAYTALAYVYVSGGGRS